MRAVQSTTINSLETLLKWIVGDKAQGTRSTVTETYQ